MSSKNNGGKNLLAELFLIAASLAGSALLLKWSLGQIDPNADSKKAAKHKKKEIARRLGHVAGSIETNAYEDVIALEVVTHDDLDVQGLGDVGGLERVKEALHNKVIAPLREPALFRSSLLRQARGVLLYGPPGTGKTMLAKALASESGACFIPVKPSTLQSKWFGETNKLVTAVFSLACKLQPSIIFIDEVDALLGKRRDQEHEAVTAMKTEFMQLWDGFSTDPTSNVMVLAATNRPFDLDEAVLRRFSAQFEVPLPDEAQREAILRLTLAKHVEEAGEATVERLLRTNTPAPGGGGGGGAGGGGGKGGGPSLGARRRPLAEVAAATRGFSGSDLHELCSAAAAIPVHEFMAASAASSGSNGSNAAETFEDAQEAIEGDGSGNGGGGSGRTRRSTTSSRRTKSPPRGSGSRSSSSSSSKPRQLSLADFHTVLRTMRPSGDAAAAYRASVNEASGGGVFGGGMDALAALAAAFGAGAGGAGLGGGGAAGRPAGAA